MKIKGENRPFFNQKSRAQILSSLNLVDFVILLDEILRPEFTKEFEERYRKFSPDFVVFGNTERQVLRLARRQANAVGCDFKHLPNYPKEASTGRIAKLILDHFPS